MQAGGVTVTVESDLGLVSDKISIAVVPTGGTGTSTNAFTWTDAAITTLSRTNGQLVADKETVVKGASVSLKYAIRDQFGKVWTKSGTSYRVRLLHLAGHLFLPQLQTLQTVRQLLPSQTTALQLAPQTLLLLFGKNHCDYTQNNTITNAATS